MRTTFLVDGFNVYRSAKEARRDLGGASTLWLDLRALLTSYLSVIGNGAELEEIYYFSALASHMDARQPGTTARHRLYIECLRVTGIAEKYVPVRQPSSFSSITSHPRDSARMITAARLSTGFSKPGGRLE